MKSKKKTFPAAAAAALFLIVFQVFTTHIGAATFTEREVSFESVGVVKGQTARINVSNTGSSPLTLNFFVLDVKGTNLLDRIELVVEPGQTGYADLNADFLEMPDGRAQIRGLVRIGTTARSIHFRASMEIFNNDTLKTEIFLPAVQ